MSQSDASKTSKQIAHFKDLTSLSFLDGQTLPYHKLSAREQAYIHAHSRRLLYSEVSAGTKGGLDTLRYAVNSVTNTEGADSVIDALEECLPANMKEVFDIASESSFAFCVPRETSECTTEKEATAVWDDYVTVRNLCAQSIIKELDAGTRDTADLATYAIARDRQLFKLLGIVGTDDEEATGTQGNVDSFESKSKSKKRKSKSKSKKSKNKSSEASGIAANAAAQQVNAEFVPSKDQDPEATEKLKAMTAEYNASKAQDTDAQETSLAETAGIERLLSGIGLGSSASTTDPVDARAYFKRAFDETRR